MGARCTVGMVATSYKSNTIVRIEGLLYESSEIIGIAIAIIKRIREKIFFILLLINVIIVDFDAAKLLLKTFILQIKSFIFLKFS